MLAGWTATSRRGVRSTGRSATPALGLVTAANAPPMPVGIAFSVSHAPSRRGPLAVFRLTVGKDEVPGRWVCVRREFVPLEDWREREAIRDEGG